MADVYDALTSERVYKSAYTHEETVRMILNGECGNFNPLLLECLLQTAGQLKEELSNFYMNYIGDNEREIRKVTKELLHHEEIVTSERMMQLLEHEREKSRFFTELAQEIQFEYTAFPSMLTISPWACEYLNLPEIVMNPLQNEKVQGCLGAENLQGLEVALHCTTPTQPMIQYDCQITVHDEVRWIRIICRITWSTGENPKYTGVIGKVVDIHEGYEQLSNHAE
jgi:putative two-component system response regulator